MGRIRISRQKGSNQRPHPPVSWKCARRSEDREKYAQFLAASSSPLFCQQQKCLVILRALGLKLPKVRQ